VMEQGKIKQAGAARDVYAHPHDRYVAEFMGGQNVLSGTVVQNDGGSVTIESGGKRIRLSAPDTPPAVGSIFEAAVRRDHVRLSRAVSESAQPATNAVAGRVSGIEYQGTWLKIALEDACSEEFVVNLPDSLFFADPLTIGAPVLAQWNTEHVHFLASGSRPGRGAASH